MRTSNRAAVAVLVAACLFFPAGANADPVAIVLGGAMWFDTGGPPFFRLNASNGYTYIGAVVGPDHSPDCCGPWSVGESVGLSSTWGHLRDPYNEVVVRSDGVSGFPVVNFVFAAPEITLGPTAEIPQSGLMMFRGPFTFSGQLAAFRTQDYTGEPLFTVTLAGSGTARLLTEVLDRGGYGFIQLEYDFESAQPVPEPGTLLLCTAAGVLLIRRHPRRGRSSPLSAPAPRFP